MPRHHGKRRGLVLHEDDGVAIVQQAITGVVGASVESRLRGVPTSRGGVAECSVDVLLDQLAPPSIESLRRLASVAAKLRLRGESVPKNPVRSAAELIEQETLIKDSVETALEAHDGIASEDGQVCLEGELAWIAEPHLELRRGKSDQAEEALTVSDWHRAITEETARDDVEHATVLRRGLPRVGGVVRLTAAKHSVR